jgi:NitT/TauT family transport system permease protein
MEETIQVSGTDVFEKVRRSFITAFRHNLPFWFSFICILAVYNVITEYSALLNPNYFPSLNRIAEVFADDFGVIVNSISHSLLLLAAGYSIGASAGLITGVLAGSFGVGRYWLMPLVKVLGPIPATAWLPIAIAAMPTTFSAALFLIAVSVWFPVTVMTASGIMNVSPSLIEAGRILGAGRVRLALSVAFPSALPTIFTGLFMGLGSSFLTLVAAEMSGVKAGIGFYIVWARDYADYARIYTSLIVASIIFFTIMTTLFKVRDRVLSWQRELIKW